MDTIISHSPEETLAVGRRWGAELPRGAVVALVGELGSGKTVLVRGLAQGAGFQGLAHSPTFTLAHEYRGGRLPVIHLDLYRLEGPEAVEAAGLAECLLAPEGITAVEWAERWFGAAPPPEGPPPALRPPLLRWTLIESPSPTKRIIRYEDFSS
ncbi:MAG: tRNA (adenosine(37)-N6)-threonylcarbamoyltransferase complex ATPase subunit type 1 TsaE [Verrucomicrobia bacterium]|nr:tRNA (adenosine(37)-N6)-threonylcarbamoyltransferase complex ATPase subunit type 1 TsaE [Verrucomicrobiota bacterium]